MQRLRDISKRADLKISETSPVRSIKDASSETSLRSLRSSQRRLRVVSETVILCFQTEAYITEAYNEYMKDYDENKESSYLNYRDVNNL